MKLNWAQSSFRLKKSSRRKTKLISSWKTTEINKHAILRDRHGILALCENGAANCGAAARTDFAGNLQLLLAAASSLQAAAGGGGWQGGKISCVCS